MQRMERKRQRPTPTRHINDSCMQQTEGKPPRLAQRLPYMQRMSGAAVVIDGWNNGCAEYIRKSIAKAPEPSASRSWP